MPSIANDRIGQPSNMEDGAGFGTVAPPISHAVDITDICEGSTRKLLEFVRKEHGGVHVRIVDCRIDSTDSGLSVTYPMSWFNVDWRSPPDNEMFAVFHVTAKEFGISSERLYGFIKEYVEG